MAASVLPPAIRTAAVTGYNWLAELRIQSGVVGFGFGTGVHADGKTTRLPNCDDWYSQRQSVMPLRGAVSSITHRLPWAVMNRCCPDCHTLWTCSLFAAMPCRVTVRIVAGRLPVPDERVPDSDGPVIFTDKAQM